MAGPRSRMSSAACPKATRTWSRAATVHHDATETQHGFGSLFVAPDGTRGLVWLDGRSVAQRPVDGNMALWSATFGADGTQTSEAMLQPRVCDCCQTSAAATDDGVVVAYRGRSPAEVRDIYLARSTGGRWSEPVLVHNDGWTINGCPVNGPAVDARGHEVVVAWFTAATGHGQAFVAFSRDGGRTFARPIRVDDGGCRGHVDVAMTGSGDALVSWTAFADAQSRFKVRRVDRDGGRSPAVAVSAITGDVYPRMARGRDEVLLAWSESTAGYAHLRAARVQLPRTPW